MNEKIEPALSPEQWQERLPNLAAYTDFVPDCQECAIGQGVGLHGAAAQCLYGQPFGFTREDVTHLAERLRHSGHNCGDGSCFTDDDDARLSGIIDRIEALLPPGESLAQLSP